MRPVCHHLSVGGRGVSAIPVMTTRGIEDVFTITDQVNGDMFERFVCECILPIIVPFDGNNHHSFLIMDNASIHHLRRIITGVGAKILFLPPYSPDLMSLEEVFSKVRSILKANDKVYTTTSISSLNKWYFVAYPIPTVYTISDTPFLLKRRTHPPLRNCRDIKRKTCMSWTCALRYGVDLYSN